MRLEETASPPAVVRAAEEARESTGARKMRLALQAAKKATSESGWELARVIGEICTKELWKQWNYASRNAWVEADLKGFYAPPAVSRIVQVMGRLEKMDLTERQELQKAPMWNVIEAFGMPDTEKAAELVKSGKTQAEIREAVREEREAREPHHGEGPGEGPAIFDPEQFVELKLLLPKSVHGNFQRACNLARFKHGSATPSLAILFESIVAEYVEGWEMGINPDFVESGQLMYTTSDGVKVLVPFADVGDGKLCCKMCGSFNSSTFQPHHIIPRSIERECCGTDHEKPIAILCGDCHASIKDGAGWRAWANKWGYAELAAKHV